MSATPPTPLRVSVPLPDPALLGHEGWALVRAGVRWAYAPVPAVVGGRFVLGGVPGWVLARGWPALEICRLGNVPTGGPR